LRHDPAPFRVHMTLSVSHTGRYVAALGKKPGTYVLEDFGSGTQVIFDALIGLHYPFFSANDAHLFMVRNTDGTARTEIYALPYMTLLAEVPVVLPSAHPMVFADGYLIMAK